jgi:hypothetical protein
MTLDDINRLDTERTFDVWLGLPEMKKASTGGENQQSGTIREMWRPKAAARHGLFRVDTGLSLTSDRAPCAGGRSLRSQFVISRLQNLCPIGA